jgi:hypothetical protein
VEGIKDAGKSTFFKTYIPRLLGYQAWDANDQLTPMRARINSRKSEDGVAEFEALTRGLYSPVYNLGVRGNINLFGLFSDEADLIEIATNIAQEVNGGRLGSDVTTAIMVAIDKMIQERPYGPYSEGILEAKLRRLTVQDFDDFNLNYASRVYSELKESTLRNPALPDQIELSNMTLTAGEDDLRAAKKAADLFGILIRGDFGRIFGGGNSLFDVLSEQVVTLSWDNVPIKAMPILEAVFMKAEANAAINEKRFLKIGDDPKKWLDLDLIVPHVIASDEEASATSLFHLRMEAFNQNTSRKSRTARFRALQYYTQVTKAGDVDTEMRNLADQVDRGVGARILFRQPNDKVFLDRYRELGMAEPDVQQLPHLRQGQAMLWIEHKPPTYFNLVVTEAEQEYIGTNIQKLRMSKFLPMSENPELLERASRLGLDKEALTSSQAQ